MYDLTFHRVSTGAYVAAPTDSATEFVGSARKIGRTWWAEARTFDLLLISLEFKTLAEAKARLQETYRTVEPAARGEA